MCWSLFLLKLKAFRPATLSKRDSNTDAFLRILQNFQKSISKNIRKQLVLLIAILSMQR